VCDAGHNYVMKTVLGDLNAEVQRKPFYTQNCGGHSLHNVTNDFDVGLTVHRR